MARSVRHAPCVEYGLDGQRRGFVRHYEGNAIPVQLTSS
jgi:hypothetical protein